MSAPASGELFDVVVAKAVELETRVKELEPKLEAQTKQLSITTGERNRLKSEQDDLRRAHESRRSRVANAVESLRSTFTLRADCNNIEDAVADACAELERVQVKRGKYRDSYEKKCAEVDQLIQDRETGAVLDTEMRAYDELTFIGVCEARDKLKADLEIMTADRDRYKAFEHDVSAFDASVVISKHAAEQNVKGLAVKVEELKQRLECASMTKREAIDILTRCEQGVQNCHRCPALGCGDNRTGEL